MPHPDTESLIDALDRMQASGYSEDFRSDPGGLRGSPSGAVRRAESFVVDEVVRFEGDTDPDEEVMLLALRCAEDDLRGTFVVSFGPSIDPVDARRIRSLELQPGSRVSR